MIFDLILLDRTERAKTDVQRDIAEPYTHVRDLLQELLRKVQTGRRCGCAAELTGIDRLVALLILKLRLDIRRQRHFAQPLEHLKENALIVKLHDLVAIGDRIDDRGSQFPVTERQRSAGLCLASRPGQALPFSVTEVAQQQHLDRSAGAPVPEQTCRKNT